MCFASRSSGISKGGGAMDVFEFMQVVGFALAFFAAGYSLGRKK